MDAPHSCNTMTRVGHLFFGMLSISACTFGGGFVIVSLMKQRFARDLGYLTEEEVLDLTVMAQSCPGSIAVNAAILLGWRVAGFAGFLAALAGTILPPLVILSLISVFYSAFAASRPIALLLRGMQAGACAVLLDVAWGLLARLAGQKSLFALVLAAAAFVGVWFLKINASLLLLIALCLGLVRFALYKRRKTP